jgi:hypothetical protein
VAASASSFYTIHNIICATQVAGEEVEDHHEVDDINVVADYVIEVIEKHVIGVATTSASNRQNGWVRPTA